MSTDRQSSAVPGEPPAPAPTFRVRLWWAGLSVALLVALGVRLYGLGQQDFWLDEIYSLTSSAGRFAELRELPHGVVLEGLPRWTDLTPESTWPGVWRGMASDSHPPLYFLLLSSWRRVLGDSEFMLRLLSVIASVASLLPIALIFREYERRWTGVAAVALLAFAFSHIHAAEQCRPYALVMLFLSLSFLSLVKMERRRKNSTRRWRIAWVAVYVASVYCAMMTHYLSLPVLAGQVVFAAVRLRGPVRWIWLAALFVAVLAFAATWGPSLLRQLDFMAEQSWRLEHHPDHAVRTLQRVADLPVRLLFAHAEFKFSLARTCLGLAALAGALGLLLRRRCGAALVFALWYLIPVLILTAVDLAQQKQTLAMLRYTVLAAPGLAGVLALAVGGLRPWMSAGTAAGAMVAIVATLTLPPSDNPHNRIAADLIARRLGPGTLLVFDAIDWQPFWVSQVYNNVAYYLHERLTPPFPPVVLLREAPEASLVSEMASYDRVIVVSPRVDVVPNPAPDRFHPVDRTPYVDQIGYVYVFERTANPESP